MVRVGFFDFLPMAVCTKVLNLLPVLALDARLELSETFSGGREPVRKTVRSFADLDLDHHEDLLCEEGCMVDMAERGRERECSLLQR